MDILDLYFVEYVKKIAKNEACDDFFVELCHFAVQSGDVRRCQKLFERIIGHTNNKRPEIAAYLAETEKIQGDISGAYKNFFKCRNEKEVIYCLERAMASGYESE